MNLVYNKTPARRIEVIWHSAFRLVPYITSYSSRCRGISVKYLTVNSYRENSKGCLDECPSKTESERIVYEEVAEVPLTGARVKLNPKMILEQRVALTSPLVKRSQKSSKTRN